MPPARKLEFASVDVQGIPIACVGLRAAVEQVVERARQGDGGYFSFTGAHGIVEARRDARFRAALLGAAANFADGMPVVWSARRGCGDDGRAGQVGRVLGPDFMEALFAANADFQLRHFLCGGGEGLVERLADRLRESYPSVTIAGTDTPPFRPLSADERHDLIGAIDTSGANVVWIGLSTPKQENLMAELAADLPGRLLFGVGAAFDIHAGLAGTAPPRVQDLGLEWAWRLLHEPRRLLPRYARVVPGFLGGELAALWNADDGRAAVKSTQ